MTVGGHFERVAAMYESLRTTDEAPVRTIGQFLPDRPVTGLDIGCGTGRYTRLLRAAAAGRLAAGRQRRLGGHAGTAPGRQPAATPMRWSRCWQRPKNCHCGPPASTWSPRSTACTTSTSAASWPPPRGCCGPAASCSSTPAPRSRTRARSGAATSPVSPSTSSACTARPRSGTPSGGPAGSRWPPHRPSSHPRTSTAERLRAQAEGRHYSTFSFYPPQELRAAIAVFLASPARPRSVLDRRAPPGHRRQAPQPGSTRRPSQPGEPGHHRPGPPDQRQARRPGSPKTPQRPRAGHPVKRPADCCLQPSASIQG